MVVFSLLPLFASASACVGSCPEAAEPIALASGTYASTGQRESEPRSTPFPHGAEDKTLEVDREAGLVRIRYERDGQAVVETWRITGPAQEP